jgi:hypothetical protein
MIKEIGFFAESERKKIMYKLIIDGDGVDKSASGTFKSFDDALYWYDYAKNNGADSAALWRGQELIKFFIRE